MVQTRRQYRQWMEEERRQPAQEQYDDPDEWLADLGDLLPSQVSSLGLPISQSQPTMQAAIAQYRPNDRFKKKHRLHDTSPYSQNVKSYKRRTPL